MFRVATHCTEATVSKTHIDFLRKQNKKVLGVLMMCALSDKITLLENAKIMQDYGAEAIIIMDSTGTFLPEDVKQRIEILCTSLSIEVGFHAHNNLGCAIFNSLTAVQAGAKYVDACIRGFGAGAGNAALEILLPVFQKSNIDTGVDFEKVIIEADRVTEYLVKSPPNINPVNVLTGLNKLFSGFEKPIIEAARINQLEYSSLIFELGNRKLVAGQEDLIIEIAKNFKTGKNN